MCVLKIPETILFRLTQQEISWNHLFSMPWPTNLVQVVEFGKLSDMSKELFFYLEFILHTECGKRKNHTKK